MDQEILELIESGAITDVLILTKPKEEEPKPKPKDEEPKPKKTEDPKEEGHAEEEPIRE